VESIRSIGKRFFEARQSRIKNNATPLAVSQIVAKNGLGLEGYQIPRPPNMDDRPDICVMNWQQVANPKANLPKDQRATFLADVERAARKKNTDKFNLAHLDWSDEHTSTANNGHPRKGCFLKQKRLMIADQISREATRQLRPSPGSYTPKEQIKILGVPKSTTQQFVIAD
jgi:hypothetical protein